MAAAKPQVAIYGIKACDTMKKARAWLADAGVEARFYDYKVEGADPVKLKAWARAVGWERLLNRAGTTFRGLSYADKADIDEAKAIALMAASPSLIKRPVLEHPGGLLVGFKPEDYAAALGR